MTVKTQRKTLYCCFCCFAFFAERKVMVHISFWVVQRVLCRHAFVIRHMPLCSTTYLGQKAHWSRGSNPCALSPLPPLFCTRWVSRLRRTSHAYCERGIGAIFPRFVLLAPIFFSHVDFPLHCFRPIAPFLPKYWFIEIFLFCGWKHPRIRACSKVQFNRNRYRAMGCFVLLGFITLLPPRVRVPTLGLKKTPIHTYGSTKPIVFPICFLGFPCTPIIKTTKRFLDPT